MVHDERDRTVHPFDSTVMLDPIPGTWSPGDEPGDPVYQKKLLYFQSTMFTECLPGATVLDKVKERKGKFNDKSSGLH